MQESIEISARLQYVKHISAAGTPSLMFFCNSGHLSREVNKGLLQDVGPLGPGFTHIEEELGEGQNTFHGQENSC